MQDGIGDGTHSLGADLAGGWAKEREQFGCPAAFVLVRLEGWVCLRLPEGSWLGNGLIGPCLIFAELYNPRRFRLLIGELDQSFFSSVSWSYVVTVPLLRLRKA